MSHSSRLKETRKVLAVILVLNWIIAGVKTSIGVITGSTAVTANGIESFADGASNIVGLIALKSAAAPPDDEHPYGHGKFETFATAIIGSLLIIAGWNITKKAITILIDFFQTGELPPVEVDPILLTVLALTLVANFFIVTYETKKGKQLKSSILIADAAHTKTDLLSTSAVIVSFFLTAYIPLFDPIMSLIIGVIIFKTAYEIFMEIADILGDKQKIKPELIEELFEKDVNVIKVEKIRSRGVDNQIYVDLIVELDGNLKLSAAHKIAEDMEITIIDQFPEVVDVTIHMEPSNK